MQSKEKQMNQTWENTKKPSFAPILVSFVKMALKFYFVRFTSTSSLRLFQAIILRNFKESK